MITVRREPGRAVVFTADIAQDVMCAPAAGSPNLRQMEDTHLTKFLETFRRLIRLATAVAFWSNAFLIARLTTPPFADWAATIHLTLAEAAIISALVILTALRSYGLRKFSVDLAYVYFFPFVLIYYLCRLLVVAGKGVRHTFRRQRPELAPATPPEVVEVKTTREGPCALGASKPRESGPNWRGFFRGASRLFLRFTILWGLLLIFASQEILVEIALVVVLGHLFRMLLKVGRLGWRCFKWLSAAEQNLTIYVEGLFARLASIDLSSELTPDQRQVVSILVAIRTSLKLLPAINRVARWAVTSSLWAFGAVYSYLALLFSFAYYGAARVQSIPYTWPQALVTSVFIPALVGHLPRNAFLMLLGAIQWTIFAGLGLGALVTYYNRRLAELQRVTQLVNERLQNPNIRMALDEYEKRTRVVPGGSAGQ